MTGSEERPRTQPITEVKAGKGYHLALAELSLCAQLLKSISNLRIIKKKKPGRTHTQFALGLLDLWK